MMLLIIPGFVLKSVAKFWSRKYNRHVKGFKKPLWRDCLLQESPCDMFYFLFHLSSGLSKMHYTKCTLLTYYLCLVLPDVNLNHLIFQVFFFLFKTFINEQQTCSILLFHTDL